MRGLPSSDRYSPCCVWPPFVADRLRNKDHIRWYLASWSEDGSGICHRSKPGADRICLPCPGRIIVGRVGLSRTAVKQAVLVAGRGEPYPPPRTAGRRLLGLSDTVIALERCSKPRGLRAVAAANLPYALTVNKYMKSIGSWCDQNSRSSSSEFEFRNLFFLHTG